MWRLILPIVLLLSNISFALDLDYKKAKDLTLKNSRLLKAYKMDADVSYYKYRQALGGYMPSINLTGTYSKTDEPGNAAFSKMKQGKFTMNYFNGEMADPDKVSNYKKSITLTQPIFMQGQLYYGVKQAGEAKKASQFHVKRVEQMLLFDFYRSFYGFALAGEAKKVAESSFKRTRQYYEMTNEFYKNGLVVKSDVLVAESYLIANEQALKEAEKNLAIAESNMQRLIDSDESLSINCEKPDLSTSGSLNDLIANALSTRKDLQAMNSLLNIQRYGKRMAKSKFLPQVMLFADYEENDEHSFGGNDGHGATVGAVVSVNLFGGFQDYNKIKETNSSYLAMLHRIADKKLEIKTEVKSAYYGVDAAIKKVEVAGKRLESSKSALKITENRFKEGLSKITELLDREVEVRQAELAVCISDYEKIVQEALLLSAIGLLK
jgi:outer membrane protein TolC